MHLKKGWEHFRSNGYLSWLHYIPFSVVLRGYWRSCILCAILRDNCCGRSCSEIHEWQKDALGSSYHHFNATKEGFGALQEQRMYLLVVQYLIVCTERVSKIWYFVCNLRVNRGWTWHGETNKWLADTVNSFSHLPSSSKTGLKQFIRYECLFLQFAFKIFHTERIPKTCILLVIWESTFVEHSLVWPTSV